MISSTTFLSVATHGTQSMPAYTLSPETRAPHKPHSSSPLTTSLRQVATTDSSTIVAHNSAAHTRSRILDQSVMLSDGEQITIRTHARSLFPNQRTYDSCWPSIKSNTHARLHTSTDKTWPTLSTASSHSSSGSIRTQNCWGPFAISQIRRALILASTLAFWIGTPKTRHDGPGMHPSGHASTWLGPLLTFAVLNVDAMVRSSLPHGVLFP
jgi:hypothetical protein